MKGLKIGQIGIGGFGGAHLRNIKALAEEKGIILETVCDRDMERYSENLNALELGSPRKYTDSNQFLAEEKQLDLVIISTPIPLHKTMACSAMKAGYNVLLEKPPAVTIQDIDEIIDARESTGRACMVGFQMTSALSFVKFKEILSSEIIGDIKTITGVGVWRRQQSYFGRSPWVGKLLYNGNYVLDGTVNNPLAHVLNNCLLLSGLKDYRGSIPEWVQGELYRSNPIESEDTSCLRIRTASNVEVYFYGTICAEANHSPYISVSGSKGEAVWNYNGSMEFKDLQGNIIRVEKIESNPHQDHFSNVIDYLKGINNTVPCPIEATKSFVLASNLAFESSVVTHRVDPEYLEYFNEEGKAVTALKNPGDSVHLKDIEAIISKASKEGKLFSELGVEWAVKSEPFYNKGYKCFNLYRT